MDSDKRIIGKEDIFYPFYFRIGSNNPIWLNCYVLGKVTQCTYYGKEGRVYPIPVDIMDYKLNKESHKLESLRESLGGDGIIKKIENIKGVLLYQNLNFEQGDQFELLLRKFAFPDPKDRHNNFIHRNIIDKIIIKG